MDVGSGAGLPGLVIALLRPDLEVVLLEPARKKHAFLRSAVRSLGLTHVQALALDADAYRASPEFRPHDAAVSRATWPLPEWLERGASLVGPGGVVLGLEGGSPVPLPVGARRHPYILAGRRRAVVVLRRS